MNIEEIKQIIEKNLAHSTALVEGDGYHFEATVVCPAFVNQSSVKRQQMVYAILQEQITNGAIHALSLKTLTPEQWDNGHG